MALLDIQCSRAMWWLLALVLADAFIYVVYLFIGTFVFGLFVYYAMRPIYWRVHRRVKPPNLAATMALPALVLSMLGLVVYAATIALHEFLRHTNRLSTDEISAGFEAHSIDPTLLEGIIGPQALLEYDFRLALTLKAFGSVFDSLSVAASTFAFLGIGAIYLLITIAFASYLLRDGHCPRRWGQLMFVDDHGILEAYMRGMDRDSNDTFFGNVPSAVLTGIIGVIAYSLLDALAPVGVRIPASVLIGLLAGVVSLILVVGMELVYVPIAGYMGSKAAIVNPPKLWSILLFAAISFAIMDTIPDFMLRPYVFGRSLHVGAVILAYTFGPLLFDWYSIFLMPMTLVLLVDFARLVLPELLVGKPIRPYMAGPAHLIDGPPVEEPTADEADDTQ